MYCSHATKACCTSGFDSCCEGSWCIDDDAGGAIGKEAC